MGWIERRLGITPPPTIVYTDPLRAGRHPAQTFLLALCVISSAPLLVGRETAGSIEQTLPPWLAFAWGLALFCGSLTALIGSQWRGDEDKGLTLERIGLDITGLAGVAYSFAIVAATNGQGTVAAAIVLGFSVFFCLRRARDIARLFHRAANGD